MASIHFARRQFAAVCFFMTWLQGVLTIQILTNTTLPRNVTTPCGNALISDVGCSPVITAFKNGGYYSQRTLERVCITSCDDALHNYETRVRSACGEQIWNGYYNESLPVAIIPGLLRYQYNQSCLMDSGRYCNVVAAQFAMNNGTSSLSSAGPTSSKNVTNCDLCFIKKLQFLAGSPYYDGPELASASVYESKTSSCGVTGYPLSTSTLSFGMPTSISLTTPTPCLGKGYSIQLNDDCKSISRSQGIGTAWLLTDNGLKAYCADFPASGNLCLTNTCKTYTVQMNDTCGSISKSYNITTTQLLAWNPIIDRGCSNLNKAIDYSICVGEPGTQYNPSISPFPIVTSATTAAPVPTDVAEGTNRKCGKYYMAIQGDYCNLLTIKFAISLADFAFLNPKINSNCTNLLAEFSYCVQAVGDINTYPGRPGFASATSTVVGSTVIFSNLPDATYVSTANNNTALPFADKTRADCNWYINGNEYQEDWSGGIYRSNCDALVAVYSVTLDELGYWNPSLGNTSLASCAFDPAKRYCARWYAEPRKSSAEPVPNMPIRDGATPNCTEYFPVYRRMTCQGVLDATALTIAQFFEYNPAVKADCSGLWSDYQYCVRAPGYVDQTSPTGTSGTLTSTATIAGSATASSNLPVNTGPPGPIQSGQPANCVRWHTAIAGDSCDSIENNYLITNTDFHQWNPAISADCSSGLWANYAYCVGTTDNSPTRTSQSVVTSNTPAPLPSPTQANSIVSNCNKYAMTMAGDYCSLFAQNNGISTTDLYMWNAVLNTDGSGCGSSFWRGYYYCVGVST